jgi:mono/diheme cytochrome c family protein
VSHVVRFVILVGCLVAFAPPLDAAERADVTDELFFARRVWPVLVDKCLACHGNDEKNIKGGLDLRTRAAALHGGESGEAAAVAGSADRSPLYLAATRTSDDWSAMPPM